MIPEGQLRSLPKHMSRQASGPKASLVFLFSSSFSAQKEEGKNKSEADEEKQKGGEKRGRGGGGEARCNRSKIEN